MQEQPTQAHLHEVAGEVAAGQVQAQDCMRQCIPLIDGHCVCHTITCMYGEINWIQTEQQPSHPLVGGKDATGLSSPHSTHHEGKRTAPESSTMPVVRPEAYSDSTA